MWNQSTHGDAWPFSRMSLKRKKPRLAWLNTPSSTTLKPRSWQAFNKRSKAESPPSRGSTRIEVVRVVTVVAGRLEDRIQVQGSDSKVLQVIEVLDDADQVASLVAVYRRLRPPMLQVRWLWHLIRPGEPGRGRSDRRSRRKPTVADSRCRPVAGPDRGFHRRDDAPCVRFPPLHDDDHVEHVHDMPSPRTARLWRRSAAAGTVEGHEQRPHRRTRRARCGAVGDRERDRAAACIHGGCPSSGAVLLGEGAGTARVLRPPRSH